MGSVHPERLGCCNQSIENADMFQMSDNDVNFRLVVKRVFCYQNKSATSEQGAFNPAMHRVSAQYM